MLITGLDHVTIRVLPEQVGLMKAFYADVLGLEVGPRTLTFPGVWLYSCGRAIVHVAGNLDSLTGHADDSGVVAPGFDHFAFQSRDLAAVKTQLDTAGIVWHEVWRPHLDVLQLVLHDPAGTKVELTFDPAEHPERMAASGQ